MRRRGMHIELSREIAPIKGAPFTFRTLAGGYFGAGRSKYRTPDRLVTVTLPAISGAERTVVPIMQVNLADKPRGEKQMPVTRPLTDKEIARAAALREHIGDGKRRVRSWRQVGKLTGLGTSALLRHFAPETYEKHLARNRGEQRRSVHFRDVSDMEGGHFRVPPDVLADRERRREIAMEQDPIAALLGEPVPGRSALDRKLARSS